MYLLLNSNSETPAGKIKWNSTYNFNNETWKKIYLWPHIITKDTTLKWFQYRINHNILATNDFLNKIKIASSPLCTFCKKFSETIKHLFWDCEATKNIFIELQEWLATKNITITINENSFIFGIYEKTISIFKQLNTIRN